MEAIICNGIALHGKGSITSDYNWDIIKMQVELPLMSKGRISYSLIITKSKTKEKQYSKPWTCNAVLEMQTFINIYSLID